MVVRSPVARGDEDGPARGEQPARTPSRRRASSRRPRSGRRVVGTSGGRRAQSSASAAVSTASPEMTAGSSAARCASLNRTPRPASPRARAWRRAGRGDRSADLFEQKCGLEHAVAATAVLLREAEAEQVGLGQLRPDVPGEPVGSASISRSCSGGSDSPRMRPASSVIACCSSLSVKSMLWSPTSSACGAC